MFERLRRAVGTGRSLVDPSRVGFLICYVTNRCNFRCGHCFYHAEIARGRKPDELTVAELESVARKLGALVQLSLTGGEPFVREEMNAIANAFVEHTTPRYLTVPTNGWFTDRIVRFVDEVVRDARATNFRVVFSVDGIGADHDAFRGAPGSYARIGASYAALEKLRRLPNLVVDANVAYTARNEDRVVSILETLDRDFAFDNLSVTYVRGEPKELEMRTRSREAYSRALDFLRARARRREHRLFSSVWRAIDDVTYDHFERTVFGDEYVTPCVAGRKLAVLGETGDVHPCEILGVTVGNVRDHDFDLHAVLESAANKRTLDHIRETECKCGFECALAANVVWNTQSHARVARRSLHNLLHESTLTRRRG